MVSHRLRVRLEQREAVLRLLDRRRAETGDPNLGRGMETKILDLELADLVSAVAAEESAERALVPKVDPKGTGE
ncbi:MAG TPA: hypothetical protein VK335_24470 [Bryobacteraceae bacterium]|nr:hypothetical protein [Bryobacteraceae bacterium]HXR17224.1 hypothetical protein [Terriglobales bacterium]HZW92683.1 hypothetical protein [Candidatus Eremiobacteraceae bacterium]